jgi:hypothetical protein
MAQTLVHGLRAPAARLRRPPPREDALDPIRGIMIGALLSIAGFWLPLAVALSH